MTSPIVLDNRPGQTGTPTVLVDQRALDPFLQAAVAEYQACTPQRPPRCWALLLGRISEETIRLDRINFAGNVRETDESVLQEFSEVIVPDYGEAYRNGRRGFWCDSADLLAITRQAEAEGLELIGSVHLHPDWHRIGPPRERVLQISQHPTPMDEYVFRNTAWPLNLICYLEQHGGEIFHTLGAWGPAGPDNPDPVELAVMYTATESV